MSKVEMKVVNVNGVIVNSECELVVGSNDKRVGSKSWMRFEGYIGSKNVGEYLEKGGLIEDLRYDVKKGKVKLLESYDYKNKVKVKI